VSGAANSFTGTSGTVIQVGTLNGSVELGQAARRTLRLVPAVTSVFQDRDGEFASLDAWAEQMAASGSRLWIITGDAGIGKTTLALTWINENRLRFGDAQIAMECGGGPGEGRGRSIEEVCDRYFALTGIAQGTPGTLTAKIEMLSSLIDGQMVALLLDDAQSAAQVLPFLSSLQGVLIMVTSTVPPSGLAQYRPRELRLAPLPDEAVAELLTEIVGEDRVAAEPEPFTQLVRICAGLPLLASHAAGLLHDDKDLSLSELVRRMTEQGRLAALEAGHDDEMVKPSAVFEVMYRELSGSAARLYRAIGQHPVRDFDEGLVIALAALSPADWAGGLGQLRRRGLVRSDRRGRYLMDDLTYEHAGLVAARDTDPDERRQIRSRIADYYLRGAIAASRCLSPRWTLGPLYRESSPFALPDFRTAEDATALGAGVDPIAWTRENLPAIMACMERTGRAWDPGGPVPGYRWQMAEATNAYFTHEGRNDERATILAWAEEDADACRDPDAQARIQVQWGEMLCSSARGSSMTPGSGSSARGTLRGRAVSIAGRARRWNGWASPLADAGMPASLCAISVSKNPSSTRTGHAAAHCSRCTGPMLMPYWATHRRRWKSTGTRLRRSGS
jgi:hypothetical protein